MNQDGYTLVEMLAALFIVGLAISGLTEGMLVIGRVQGDTTRALGVGQSLNSIQVAFDQLFERQGPFPSPSSPVFVGRGDSARFNCGRTDPCGAALAAGSSGLVLHIAGPDGSARNFPLAGFQSAHFQYVGTRTYGPVWPASSEEPQTLQAVGLIGTTASGEEVPVASVKVWLQQAPNCEFDAIVRACRG